jgi:hypothetical protein
MNGKRAALSKLTLILIVLAIVLAMPIEAYATLQLKRRPLVYMTDFENIVKEDAHRLSMPIAHQFTYGAGGATFWMEGLDRKTFGITCHSGSRCVGMELTDITKSRRNEFNIPLNEMVGDEIFVSVWLYLPADYQLHGPEPQWETLIVPYQAAGSPWQPSAAVHTTQTPLSSAFGLTVDYTAYDGSVGTISAYNNFPLPRGRWFQCQYYVKHSPTDGALKVWVDGILIIDKSGFATAHSNEEWLTSIAKIYYNDRDTFSPYRIWVDDLQIYNKIP